MESEQSASHRLSNKLPHGVFLPELDLAFGRMNVHVHFRRIDLYKHASHRIPPFHKGRVVALDYGKVQSAVLHRPPVHKQVLILSCGPR
jgi:hypothetical protein